MHAHITLDEASVEVVDDDGRVAIVLSGPCDRTTAERVLQLAEAVRDDDTLVLDLRGVTVGRREVAQLLRTQIPTGLTVRE